MQGFWLVRKDPVCLKIARFGNSRWHKYIKSYSCSWAPWIRQRFKRFCRSCVTNPNAVVGSTRQKRMRALFIICTCRWLDVDVIYCIRKIGIEGVDYGQTTTLRRLQKLTFRALKPFVGANDEWLAFETSALRCCCVGNLTQIFVFRIAVDSTLQCFWK